jgi:hypothetical protein
MPFTLGIGTRTTVPAKERDMTVYGATFDEPMRSGDGRRRVRRCRWRPLELVAMILGFIVFWPIGLAILGFKLWQKRHGEDGDLVQFVQDRWRSKSDWGAQMWSAGCGKWNRGGDTGFRSRSSGNFAFDDWRDAELARLEEERQKLVAAEREFGEFMENLRRAKDREEFDRFMNARRTTPSSEPPAAH